MRLKAKIKKLVRKAYDAERSYVRVLSASDRTAMGEPHDWAPKDVLAHVSAWKEWTVINYQAVKRGENVPERGGDQEMNQQFFEKHRHRPWEEILEYHEQTYRSLVEALEAMSATDLLRTEGLPWQGGRPFWKMVVGTGYIHPLTHLRDPLLARGDFARAVEMEEQAYRLVSELDESATWRGTQRYNLACTYSLVGQKDKAIRTLREALQMYPDLKEWSKTDPDFEPIREHPEYKAIYIE